MGRSRTVGGDDLGAPIGSLTTLSSAYGVHLPLHREGVFLVILRRAATKDLGTDKFQRSEILRLRLRMTQLFRFDGHLIRRLRRRLRR